MIIVEHLEYKYKGIWQAEASWITPLCYSYVHYDILKYLDTECNKNICTDVSEKASYLLTKSFFFKLWFSKGIWRFFWHSLQIILLHTVDCVTKKLSDSCSYHKEGIWGGGSGRTEYRRKSVQRTEYQILLRWRWRRTD